MRIYLSLFGVAVFAVACFLPALSADLSTRVDPTSLPALTRIDKRFQAYNIEMLEVTGGRFWKPYKSVEASSGDKTKPEKSSPTPAGMNPNLYQYRPPTDLSNARLRKLAAALGPTYVRVSGTWANTTYFSDADGPAPATPPKGFNGVLTRKQWKNVIDFARAANAEVITSVATSAGTRNAEGTWTTEQAQAFFSYTKSIGGNIAASEFMNEPNIAAIGGAPKGYNAAQYARDVAVFRPFLKQAAPGALFLGPGSVAESSSTVAPAMSGMLNSEELLKATGPIYDAFSYHVYPAVSQRCSGMSPATATTQEAALSEKLLARADEINAFYTSLRNRFEPGKPLWVTETADAACGGNPWASTFLDTFRYLDEHARLAQQSVQVVAHNTLAASDYGLVDENTFAPRPNYWAALLWRRLMGTTVLKPSSAKAEGLHLYAHCLSDVPGGVTLLAINSNRSSPQTLAVSKASERYTLSASKLDDTRVDLNGKELKLAAGDSIPQLTGMPTPSGSITLAPASITFLAIREARNASCRSSL